MSRYAPAIATYVAVAIVLVFSQAASAALILSVDGSGSTEGLGTFDAMIDYVPGASTGTLTIALTNTNSPANGGYITGFVFNINSSDSAATATLTSASHPFLGLTNHKAPPFGMSFDAGAALMGNWTGGGKPSHGVGVGETGMFVFKVSASDALWLSPESFVSGAAGASFVARFRGFNDGGSDKIPVLPPLIPAPAALGLLALGGLAGRTRRRA